MSIDSLRIDTRWPEVDALLDLVLDQPASEREAWLQAHCDDAELRTLVLSLLAADSLRGAGIEARADAAHGWLDARATELPQVPGYRVLRLIGEGGMASVFLAERVLGQTVQRVALKRLRLNVYDRDERRRFEHEHRILARLEHPGIARLVDAGIAPDGVPWFAMEYVEGEPLIAWCDARKLDPDARLALFADICTAIHHAHQHLVVHRDLKPSNILVDDDGRVKVLDFGIARLLDPDTGDGGDHDGTRTGQRRLTPGYAAPEQYAGHASTATDIYAMGVLLVELLSGQRPAAGREPHSDPLRGLTVTGADAGARSSTTRALERLLSGDLGAIARKAMRSDPALRYGSAQALGDELAALRAGRPVAARRGDWRYRTACFVRRNKLGVAATVLIATILVAATGISLRQAQRANAQAARAQAVQAFVEDMLAPLREGVPRARMPPLDELLAKGVAELDRSGSGGRDPAVYSELLVMFARTYDRMGDIDTARTLAQRAYAHSVAAFGADDPRTVQALAMRGRMHARFGDREQAGTDLAAALAHMRRQGDNGAPLAMVLDDLGYLELESANALGAADLFARAQRERASALGPAHPDLAIGYANLAEAEDARGDKPASLRLFQQAYRHCVVHEGTDTRQAAIYLGRTGLTQCELGYWRAGSGDYLKALAIFDRLDQRDHPERLDILNGGCSAYIFLDEVERAEAFCDQAVAMAARLYGEGSRPHATSRGYRIKLYAAQGRLSLGHSEAAAVRAHLSALPGDQERSPLWIRRFLSDVQAIEGDHVALRDALVEPLRAGRWDRAVIVPVLTARVALACAGAPAPACPDDLVARADALMAEPLHRDNPLRIDALLPLARLALHRGDIVQANARFDEIQRLAALPFARLPPTHRWLAEARMLRGEALAAQGDRAGARREWTAAEAVFAARYPDDHPFRRQLAAQLHDVAAFSRPPSPGQPTAR